MKKIFLLVTALILTAACTPPSTNREAAPAANMNAKAPPIAAMTEADAIAKEKAIWDAVKNKDYDAFSNMLADEQLEVTGEAAFDKAGSIAAVKDFEPTELVFSDWKFLSIDKDAFVVTYTVKVKGKFKGKEFPAESGRASSAWVNRNGKWLAIYHQECPVKPAMPPAATSPKISAAATATPAGTPAMATTGSDAIANEKIVWDLFKAKDYDGFAVLLASNFIDVEPDDFYDKAGAVKGIRQMNASKAVLSDWKSLKLDDDASLVTFTLKLTGMPGDGERHSTIWAKQDGKWLALLHHGGTPVMKPAAMVPKESASPAMKAPEKKM
ncbi:MAG: DUF4440 domain-containing protein [Pyrinomonadaceae bacterium]